MEDSNQNKWMGYKTHRTTNTEDKALVEVFKLYSYFIKKHMETENAIDNSFGVYKMFKKYIRV